MRYNLSRYANPVIAHPHDGRLVLRRDGQLDASAGWGVFGGIVDEVAQHLSKARAVTVEVQRGRRQGDDQGVAVSLDQGAGGFQGSLDHCGNVDPLLAQRYLAADETFDIEEIVDQPDEQLELAIHHAACKPHTFLAIPRVVQQLETALHGGERVAQLVRKHREELILTPIGLAQCFFGARTLADVVVGLENRGRIAGLVAVQYPTAGDGDSVAIALDVGEFSVPCTGAQELSFELGERQRKNGSEQFMRDSADRFLLAVAVEPLASWFQIVMRPSRPKMSTFASPRM